ncbi:11496_t:CDS:10 [Entrophospora sp. SA101]|nr:11496_t:CDS:10 [Entrophospora sp. SA101]
MPQKLGKKQACGNNRLCDLYYHKAISQKNAENAKQKRNFATYFLYKLTEIAAYTSAVVSEAYQIFDKTLRAGEDDNGNNSFYDMYDEDNVLVIVDGYETDLNDDELSDSELEDNNKSTINKIKINNINKNNGHNIHHKHNRKVSCSWSVNDEDEPPPPYDSSWTIPATSTDKISTSPKKKSFSTPKNEDQSKGTSSISATPTHRRQIRVRRGRRLFRRRASSNELKSKQRTNDGDTHYYSPITYGSPGIYSSSVGSKSSNEFSSPIPSRYHEIPPSQIQSIQSIPQFAYNNLISNRYNVALSTVGGGDFGLSSGCFMNRYRANSQYGSDFFGLKENRLLVPPRFTGYPQCRVDVIKNQESYDASLSFMIIVTLISSYYSYKWVNNQNITDKKIHHIFVSREWTLTTITLLIFDIGKLWDLHIIGEVIVVLLLSQGGRISSYWFYGIVGGYTFLVDVINISLSWPYDAIWFKCEYVREQTSTQLPIIDDEDMNMENSSSKMRKIQLHQK